MQRGTIAVLLLCFAFGCLAKEEKCNWANYSYPPPSDHFVPTYVVNLDLDPEDRWTAIVTPIAADINAVVLQVIDLMREKTRNTLEKLLTLDEPHIFKLYGPAYTGELKGIAKATGIDLAWLAAMNLMYEVTGMCTSIVAQNEDGEVYHARNLDFGLFDGYSFKNDTWDLTVKLRKILFNAQFQKGGVTQFNLTTFGGFIGALTGMKSNAFSLSVDSRFDDNLDKYLLEWLLGLYEGQELTLFLRTVFETISDYPTALKTIQSTKLMGPSYIIIGGASSGEGAVVTRVATETVDTWTLSSRLQEGSFYVVETNYDHWKPPLFIDDRRTPAERCLNETGAANINLPTLFNVLSAKPVRNQLTTQTVLMHVASGRFEAYKQWCEVPCAPW